MAIVGNFTVTIRKKPRYVNTELCTGCGICWECCPEEGHRYRIRSRSWLSHGGLHALRPGGAQIPGHRSRYLHLFPEEQVPGLRETVPHRCHRLQRNGEVRHVECGQYHPGDGLRHVRCRAVHPNMATAAWPMCSPAWSLSACATPPARPTAISSCAMA